MKILEKQRKRGNIAQSEHRKEHFHFRQWTKNRFEDISIVFPEVFSPIKHDESPLHNISIQKATIAC